MLASTLLFFPIFSRMRKRRMIRSLRSLRREQQTWPSFLRRPFSNGRLDRADRGYVQSRRQIGSCAQPDHVRDWNREEQELRGGRRDQSRFKSLSVNRASSREISAPTTFVVDLFSTGTVFQRFFLNRGKQCPRLGLLAAGHCASRWNRRSHFVVCPHHNSFLVEDCAWWTSTGHGDSNNRKRHRSWLCAVCGGKCEWRAPNRILVVQHGTNANDAKVFKAHAAPQGPCDNLINALELLANQQKDGDSPKASLQDCTKEAEEASWMG